MAMTALAGTAMLAHGNSPTRGKYAKNVQGAVEYLVRCATANGLLPARRKIRGQPMHGHGFALMFLACVYGMITKESLRQKVQAAVRKAVTLTSQGQSLHGGWTYIPGGGDEGSVTVTQVQALRAAHNAGFLVPKAVIEEAVQYLERCRTPEGGIQYSLLAGGGTQAADLGGGGRDPVQRRPVRQHHCDRLPEICLGQVQRNEGWDKGDGHCVLCAPLCRPGLLHGRRPVLGRLLPRRRETSCSPCRRPTARGTATASANGLRNVDRHHHPSASVQVPSDLPAIAEERHLERQINRRHRLAELDELNKAYAAIREQMSRQIVGPERSRSISF